MILPIYDIICVPERSIQVLLEHHMVGQVEYDHFLSFRRRLCPKTECTDIHHTQIVPNPLDVDMEFVRLDD